MDDEYTPPKLNLDGLHTVVDGHLYSRYRDDHASHQLLFLSRLSFPTRRDMVDRFRDAARNVIDATPGDDTISRPPHGYLEQAMRDYPYETLNDLASQRSEVHDVAKYLLRNHHGATLQILTGNVTIPEYGRLIDAPKGCRAEAARDRIQKRFDTGTQTIPALYITGGLTGWPSRPTQLRKVRVQHPGQDISRATEDELIEAEQTLHDIVSKIETKERMNLVPDLSHEYMTTHVLRGVTHALGALQDLEPHRIVYSPYC